MAEVTDSVLSLAALDVVTVCKDDHVQTALDRMSIKDVGAVVVVDDGMVSGIFTERDVLRHAAARGAKMLEQPVAELMTRTVRCADADDTPTDVLSCMQELGVRHMPVLRAGELVGIVSVRDLIRYYQHWLETEYEETRQLLEQMRQHTGDAPLVEQLQDEVTRYRQLSLTDPLTGIYNKRFFDRRLEEEVERARRYSCKLSMAFSDVDRFKTINDKYGHQFGDDVLRTVAGLLTRSALDLGIVSRLRKCDIVARYGGEEFVIIFPETDLDGAMAAAEKARKLVAEQRIVHVETELKVTLSFGVAEMDVTNESPADLVRRADAAMYSAKKAGRNQVVADQG